MNEERAAFDVPPGPEWSIPPERSSPDDLAEIVALQQDAYARNRPLLGVEPLPLLVDYEELLASHEVWLWRTKGVIVGVLILEDRPEDLLIWSIATRPGLQGSGLGKTMLRFADDRARELGKDVVRLYTGKPLSHLISWYGRHGFAMERIEELPDRAIVHMLKRLETAPAPPAGVPPGQTEET